MAEHPTEFVIGPSPAAIERQRAFWGGRTGLIVTQLPGAAVALIGLVLTLVAGHGWNLFFGATIIGAGLIAMWSGWLTHVRDRDRAQDAVWILRLDAYGLHLPRESHPWAETRFVATSGRRPQLLVTPVGWALDLADLDKTPTEIATAIADLSGGVRTLEES